MNFIKLTKLTVLAVITTVSALGFSGEKDPLRVTFIKNPKQSFDLSYQQQLRNRDSWKQFTSLHGHWNVIHDENTGMPLRAFGKPVSVSGMVPEHVASGFLQHISSTFSAPLEQLVQTSVVSGKKYHYVNYRQYYQGIEVLFTDIQVKMTYDLKVMQFGLACHPQIHIPASAQLSPAAAMQAASLNVPHLVGTSIGSDLKILPVPGYRKYDYHLVYEVMVETMNTERIPGKYYTLVDAVTGDVLYRVNRVSHANTDVNVTGTMYLTNPYNPATSEPLKNLRIVENGTSYYTDNNGFLNLSNTTNTTATFYMEGLWSRVRTNNVVPSWSVNLSPGLNNINIDANTNDRHRSAYNSINTVHDFMKSKFPTFTGLDYPMITNVDVAGNCNAFYDGNSVNFYASGGSCNATALVADVCYHEYGHGINDKFYQSISTNWQNGAMGEGYADIWALGITSSPVLGIGFYSNDPTGYVRRYDINKKVYPQDLVGQVHADGEIIAGCFWDTYLNLGNLQQMMDLFSESYWAGLTAPDGNEGSLYQLILIEVLTLDDNDGDLTNGTPNFCDITSAFALHGITLGAAVGMTHTEVLQSAAFAPILVDAVVTNVGTSSQVTCYYRVGGGAYIPVNMTNTGGNNYQVSLPGQLGGTVIEYYLAIQDSCGTMTNIMPVNATAANPNIPYYIMVGFNLLVHEDFDVFAGNWITGDPSDNATTGLWIIDVPMPSYIGNSVVQPGVQNTPGGIFCAVTGNASSPQAGAGENDVDNGKTTLYSPVYDLSTYTDPAFSYYRWYTNDQGATPGTDFWQVAISNDGVTWVPVENTDVSDHSWRRFVFKVLDYVNPTSTVSLRFVAEDANAGSLVEAALDDLMLWDALASGLDENSQVLQMQVYPNPVTDMLNLTVSVSNAGKYRLTVTDGIGRQIMDRLQQFNTGKNELKISVNGLASGIYQLRIQSGEGVKTQKFNVIK